MMKKNRLAAAVLMLLLFAMPALGATITVQGTAEITALPDMFTIISNVSVTDITLGRAQEGVSSVIAAVTGKLIELGVKEEDVVTQDFSYYPEYDYSGESPKLTGYRVNHSLSVTCRDMNMLDGVMGVLADSGMTETWNVNFDLADHTALYHEALVLAMSAAHDKAETMA